VGGLRAGAALGYSFDMSPTLALAIVAGAVLLAGWRWRARLRLRRRLRTEWARLCDRPRPMALIAEYHRVRIAQRGADASLDDRTCDDLHLDAVFARLDRTESVVGQQALYHRLRTAPAADDLEAFEALVDRLGADTPARERLQVALAALKETAAYHLCALAGEELRPRPWHVAFPLLAAGMVLAIASAPFWPLAMLVAICGVVVNFQVRMAAAGQTSAGLALFAQVGPLLRAADVVAAVSVPGAEPILAPLANALPRLRRLRVYARWAGRPLGNELVDSLVQYLNLIVLLDANAFYFGARELRRQNEALLAAVGAVGDVDAAIAVASYRAGTEGWTRPRRGHPGTPLRIDAVRHPLVDGAVPNDLTLAPPAGLLLTGANMSGKSTLLRTLGINVVLAQTINTCLAASYDVPVFRVRSLLGRADDLIAGKSYYLVEAEAVVQLLSVAAEGSPHLFLLDELLRGTNTVERIAAGAAVLMRLAGEPGRPGPHIVVAATHDRELVDLLDGRYTPAHLSDSIGPDGLVFDYRLRSGPATTRNAIALLALNGAPDAVVREAEVLARALDDTRRVAEAP
jgi:hypothetical protein